MSQPQETRDDKFRLGISIGDINGIGPEVIIKALLDARMTQDCTPVIYGSAGVVSFYRKQLGAAEFNFNAVRGSDKIILKKINVVNCWEEEAAIEPGRSTEASARYALKALEGATADLQSGKIDALVTAPLSKQAIQQVQPGFTGHTEY